jgi:hypothetical protein
MKPSHVMLRFVGVRKLILGSSGHSGRKAADELVIVLCLTGDPEVEDKNEYLAKIC